jgi:hypothetical protein
VTTETAAYDDEDYRPISTLAVLSLVAGCSSVLALINQILWVVPLLAVSISIAAIRDTSAQGSQKSGRGIALIGLALSVGFGVQSFAVFSGNTLIDRSRARETVSRWHRVIRAGDWDMVYGFCAPGIVPLDEEYLEGENHDNHHDGADSRKLSEIKALQEMPAIRALAACNQMMFSSIEEDTKQFPGALRVTVEVGECKQHSEDRLPLVVEIWLNHKTQKEPQLGQGTAGLQMVERWQVIRLSPSE